MSDFDNTNSSNPGALTEAEVEEAKSEELEQPAPPPVESHPAPSTALAVRSPSSTGVHTGGTHSLTLQKLTQIKELYFSYEPLESICRITGISVNTVKKQLGKPRGNGLTWRQERAEMQRQLTDTILDSSAYLLRNATDKAFRLLHIGLDHQHKLMASDPGSLTLSDLGKLADIAEKCDNLYRKESGRATDYFTVVPAEKTKEVIKSDPFVQYEAIQVNPEDIKK